MLKMAISSFSKGPFDRPPSNLTSVDPGPVPYFHGDWSLNNFYDHSVPSTDSRRAVVSYKWKYVHEVLVKCMVKLAQEKSVVRWTDLLNMIITVDWDVKPQTKQNCLALW